MQSFDLKNLLNQQEQSARPYLEFIRADSMSIGIYHLAAGSDDPQIPHNEDEVYFVISGRAMLRGGNEDTELGPGSIVFVPANEKHRFHTIQEDLTLLVLFAPPES